MGSGRDPSDISYRVAKPSSDRSSARRLCPQVLQRHPVVAKGVIYRLFDTATSPTSTSGASSRGKGGFWPVFGTATLPTGTPEASRRGEGVIYRLFGTATLPTGTSGVSSRGEAFFWPVFGTSTLAHRYVSTNPASLNRALRQERCGMRHGEGPVVLLVEVKSVVNE